ncbi:hypothetical protein HDV06_001507 [Boothiomyces sp. JEL0866]|nr:hypothetical protein HDV06_001507 [Boothiomyces sp. JEL0866]
MFALITNVLAQTTFRYPGFIHPLVYESDVAYTDSGNWISNSAAGSVADIVFSQCRELCRQYNFCKKFTWIPNYEDQSLPDGFKVLYMVIGQCTLMEGNGVYDMLQDQPNYYSGLVLSKNNCKASLNGIINCDFPSSSVGVYLGQYWRSSTIMETTILWNQQCYWDDGKEIQTTFLESFQECQKACLQLVNCTHLQIEQHSNSKLCKLYGNLVHPTNTYPLQISPDENRIGFCGLFPTRNNCTFQENYYCEAYRELPSDKIFIRGMEFTIDRTLNVAYNDTCIFTNSVLIQLSGKSEEECKYICSLYPYCVVYAYQRVKVDKFGDCQLGSIGTFTLFENPNFPTVKCVVNLKYCTTRNGEIDCVHTTEFLFYNGLTFTPIINNTTDSALILPSDIAGYVGYQFYFVNDSITTFTNLTDEECSLKCTKDADCQISQYNGAECILSDNVFDFELASSFFTLKLETPNEFKQTNQSLHYLGNQSKVYYSQLPELNNDFLGYPFALRPYRFETYPLDVLSSERCEFENPIFIFDHVPLSSCFDVAEITPFLFSYEYKADVNKIMRYIGAVSGWIVGRIDCKVNGISVQCKLPSSTNEAVTDGRLSTFSSLNTTINSNGDKLHKTAKESPISDDRATNTITGSNSASNTFIYEPTYLTVTKAATTSEVHLEFHSNYNLTPLIWAVLLASTVLNVILLLLIVNVGKKFDEKYNLDTNMLLFKPIETPRFSTDLTPINSDGIVHRENVRVDQGIRNDALAIAPSEWNLMEKVSVPTSSDIPLFVFDQGSLTNYDKIIMFVTDETLAEFDLLIRKMLLQFIPESELESLISNPDQLKVVGNSMKILPVDQIPFRTYPLLSIMYIKETASFNPTVIYRLAKYLYPHLVSMVELGSDQIEHLDIQDVAEQFIGNEMAYIMTGYMKQFTEHPKRRGRILSVRK